MRERANYTGTTMDDGQPDANADPGMGLQPATSGAQKYQPGRRERPWSAAGGNPQYAVGLVLPAATRRRQGGLVRATGLTIHGMEDHGTNLRLHTDRKSTRLNSSHRC